MRVLDPVETLLDDVLSVNNMGAKKKKQTDTPSGSGSGSRKTSATSPSATANGEAAESSGSTTCRHLKGSSVNFGAIKKKLKDCRSSKCEECLKPKAGAVQENGADEEADVFCCLACGHLGCGRTSSGQHALAHFKQPRSGPHFLVLNTRTHALWCYGCDNDIPPDATPNLKDIIDFIGKQLKQASFHASTPVSNGTKKTAAITEDTKPPAAGKSTRATTRSAVMPAEVKGLSNLGNTCFFNAVMQNMAQTHALQSMLNDSQTFLKGATISVPPATKMDNETGTSLAPLQITIDEDPMILTSSLRSFLNDFQQHKSSVLNPSSLFGQVCKKAPRFRGFQQQDSHELLRYMLDALRTEETKRLRAVIVRSFGLDPDNVKAETLDAKLKNKIKAYGEVMQMTFVEQIFGGQLLQTIRCLQCRHVSQRHEPFLDLSLPITDPKDARKLVVLKKDDDDTKNEGKKDWKLSKHQQKKAQKKSKKLAKKATPKQGSLDAKVAAEEDQKGSQATKEENNNETNNNESESITNGIEIAQVADELSTTLTLDDTSHTDVPNGETPEATIDSDATLTTECNGAGDRKSSDSDDNDEQEESKTEKVEEPLEEVDDAAAAGIEPMTVADSVDAKSECSIASCLRQFTAIELLNGKNKFGCGNCAKSNSGARTMNNGIDSSSHVANGNGSTAGEETKRNRKDSNAVMYTDAEKRYLIYSPPAILTLHLKRFQQVGHSMRKISKHVDFPLVLDVSPYCCKIGKRYNSAQKRVLYSLYGVVCHSGGLSGGHYIAYVKVRAKDDKLSSAFLQHAFTSFNVNSATANPKENGSETLENGSNIVENEMIDPIPSPGKWYYISDTHVSEVTESKVLSAEAYLLFYERIF